MKLEKNNTYGIIGTIVVHGIVLLILLLFGFAPPKVEFPEPDGILVDFGDLVIGDNTGAESPSSVTEPVSAQPEVNDAPTVTQTEVPSIPVKTNKTKLRKQKHQNFLPKNRNESDKKLNLKQKWMLLLENWGAVAAQAKARQEIPTKEKLTEMQEVRMEENLQIKKVLTVVLTVTATQYSWLNRAIQQTATTQLF